MRIGLIGVGRIGVFHASTLRGLLDAIRWVSGREVVQVYATGANRGAEFFRAAGDVAAGQAASPCTVEDAREAFYVAEACELSRHRQQPVLVAEVRQ